MNAFPAMMSDLPGMLEREALQDGRVVGQDFFARAGHPAQQFHFAARHHFQFAQRQAGGCDPDKAGVFKAESDGINRSSAPSMLRLI